MLTIASVAELLSTSTEHVLALIHAKKLHAVNIGLGKLKPRWRVPVDSLEQFTAVRPAPAPRASRRKRNPEVIEFYP